MHPALVPAATSGRVGSGGLTLAAAGERCSVPRRGPIIAQDGCASGRSARHYLEFRLEHNDACCIAARRRARRTLSSALSLRTSPLHRMPGRIVHRLERDGRRPSSARWSRRCAPCPPTSAIIFYDARCALTRDLRLRSITRAHRGGAIFDGPPKKHQRIARRRRPSRRCRGRRLCNGESWLPSGGEALRLGVHCAAAIERAPRARPAFPWPIRVSYRFTVGIDFRRNRRLPRPFLSGSSSQFHARLRLGLPSAALRYLRRSRQRL